MELKSRLGVANKAQKLFAPDNESSGERARTRALEPADFQFVDNRLNHFALRQANQGVRCVDELHVNRPQPSCIELWSENSE